LPNVTRIGQAADFYRQCETVQQLWAQVAFFGVHRADQDKLRRVLEADAFALDHVDTHRRRVEQQIDHVIV